MSVSFYLDLADYCLIAEAVTGISADVLSRMDRVISQASSALYAPQASYDGVDFYPSAEEKAAVLCSRLIANHPLPDGNKRTAFLCTIEFLARNGLVWVPPPSDIDDTAEVLLALAAHSIDESSSFTDWMRQRIAPAKDPASEAELVAAGWDAFKSGDYGLASDVFGQVATRFPSRGAFTDLAFVFLAVLEVKEARIALQVARSAFTHVGGSDARIEALTATCHFLEDDYSRAKQDFADILSGPTPPEGDAQIYAVERGSISPVEVSSPDQWTAVLALNAAWSAVRLTQSLPRSPTDDSFDYLAEFRASVKKQAWSYLERVETTAFEPSASSDNRWFKLSPILLRQTLQALR